DLVFPFFLFCLGAAIPFALQRRMEKGLSQAQAVGVVIKRGFQLFAFAVYQAHFSPYNLKTDPDWLRWVYALMGFGLLFPMMMRLPQSLPKVWHWAIRAFGWGAALWLVSHFQYQNEPTTFSIYRSNIILMLLTVSAVFGSLAWIFTRSSHLLRLGVLGILMAHRLSYGSEGWVKWITDLVSVAKIWNLNYTHYLFIVIPGTIAGDLMLQWMRHRQEDEQLSWPSSRYALLASLGVVLMVVELVGLKGRWIGATVIVSAVLVGIGFWLVRTPGCDTERFLRQLVGWGSYCLLLGLAFEPYEGGIKKDPNTMSYFFVTTGLGFYLIVTFTIVLDLWKVRLGTHLLVANGQNPMIAYVGMGNLIHPVLNLTGIGPFLEKLTPGPWLGTLRGFLLTLLLAWIVAQFTRLKIYWRT
ncbi:MAG: DUF5009 domain-containing protein, partial [Candidatus Sumerlaeaceae bacterium]